MTDDKRWLLAHLSPRLKRAELMALVDSCPRTGPGYSNATKAELIDTLQKERRKYWSERHRAPAPVAKSKRRCTIPASEVNAWLATLPAHD